MFCLFIHSSRRSEIKFFLPSPSSLIASLSFKPKRLGASVFLFCYFEELVNHETDIKQRLLGLLIYPEVKTCSSETSVEIRRTVRHIPGLEN
jgi:hypothetical protein